ncbi:MAG TPA: BBP7 family outer membrane beta-barrel protein, partial [Pirellulaceae bacterium]|nr:BBP7 family outer membrane beta-barrel protein [Pirellulaceae bacterium]
MTMKVTWTKLLLFATLLMSMSAAARAQQPSARYAAAPNYYSPQGQASTATVVVPTAALEEALAAAEEPGDCVRSERDCGGCGHCRDCGGRNLGFWGSAEYLMLWGRGRGVPALVSAGPTGATFDDSGVLPGADTLFGADRIGKNMLSAGRITAGLWLDSDDSIGVAGRFLGVESDHTGFTTDSTANPILGLPFFNVDPLVNAEDALVLGYPGVTSGGVNITTSSNIYSAEALGRVNFDRDHCSRLDLIGGYHYSRLDDGLTINSLTTVVGGVLPIGTSFNVLDDFDAKNEFHGGSGGFIYERYRGPWTMSLLGKLSIGKMYETLRIRGATTMVDVGGGVTTIDGGLLAQPTNIGTYTRNETAFIPELGVNFSRRMSDRVEFTFGYTFIYWSSVILAGDQIDRSVNGTLLSGG